MSTRTRHREINFWVDEELRERLRFSPYSNWIDLPGSIESIESHETGLLINTTKGQWRLEGVSPQTFCLRPPPKPPSLPISSTASELLFAEQMARRANEEP